MVEELHRELRACRSEVNNHMAVHEERITAVESLATHAQMLISEATSMLSAQDQTIPEEASPSKRAFAAPPACMWTSGAQSAAKDCPDGGHQRVSAVEALINHADKLSQGAQVSSSVYQPAPPKSRPPPARRPVFCRCASEETGLVEIPMPLRFQSSREDVATAPTEEAVPLPSPLRPLPSTDSTSQLWSAEKAMAEAMRSAEEAVHAALQCKEVVTQLPSDMKETQRTPNLNLGRPMAANASVCELTCKHGPLHSLPQACEHPLPDTAPPAVEGPKDEEAQGLLVNSTLTLEETSNQEAVAADVPETNLVPLGGTFHENSGAPTCAAQQVTEASRQEDGALVQEITACQNEVVVPRVIQEAPVEAADDFLNKTGSLVADAASTCSELPPPAENCPKEPSQWELTYAAPASGGEQPSQYAAGSTKVSSSSDPDPLDSCTPTASLGAVQPQKECIQFPAEEIVETGPHAVDSGAEADGSVPAATQPVMETKLDAPVSAAAELIVSDGVAPKTKEDRPAHSTSPEWPKKARVSFAEVLDWAAPEAGAAAPARCSASDSAEKLQAPVHGMGPFEPAARVSHYEPPESSKGTACTTASEKALKPHRCSVSPGAEDQKQAAELAAAIAADEHEAAEWAAAQASLSQ